MASIYLDKKSGYWYISYMMNGKRVRKSLRIKHRKLAEIKLKEIEVELAKGKLGFCTSVDKWTFYDEYCSYSQSNKREETYRKDKYVLERFFNWISHRKLDQIKPQDIEAYKKYLKKAGLKEVTINIHIRHLRSAFSYAVKNNYILENPFNKVPQFRIPEKGKTRVLSIEEESKLVEELNEEAKIVFKFLLYTGLRIGEFAHLEWEDIDFRDCVVRVTNKEKWTSKTGRNRIVPFPKFLLKDLIRLKELSPKKPLKYRTDWLTNVLRKACKKLNIEPVSAHTLRHTYASRLAAKGVSIYAISKLLGHSSVRTTEIYAKLNASDLKEEVEKAFDVHVNGKCQGNGQSLTLTNPNSYTTSLNSFINSSRLISKNFCGLF